MRLPHRSGLGMRLLITRRKKCRTCGRHFTKSPSVSVAKWPKVVACSRECAHAVKRGRPNPAVSAALTGRKQPAEVVAKRAAGIARAHAEGRMTYDHFRGLSGPATSQWKGDAIGYRAAHARVVAARGKASERACVDCAGVAMDWSHRHGTALSDPANYDPRCRKCHSAYDRPARLAELEVT
jgi:hypothetical protein